MCSGAAKDNLVAELTMGLLALECWEEKMVGLAPPESPTGTGASRFGEE
jgi:hypothetical protein